MLFYSNWPHPWAPSTVGDRKRFMQIQVANISSKEPRASIPCLSIHIRSVHVNLPSIIMNMLYYLDNIVVEHPEGRRIGHHQATQIIPMLGHLILKILQINLAMHIILYSDHLQTCQYGAGRVGAMRRIRNQTNVSMTLIMMLLVCPNG